VWNRSPCDLLDISDRLLRCADQFNFSPIINLDVVLNICYEFASGLLDGRVLSNMVCSESFAQPSALTG